MGRESRKVWAKRVERWRDSGLSAAEFAAEIGINVNSLRHWGWRMNAAQRESEAKATAMEAESLQWVEVGTMTTTKPEPAPPPPSVSTEKIELVLASGLTVRVPAHFEPEALRRLLAVVG